MVLDGNSLQEYRVNAGVTQWSILGPTLSPVNINDLPDDVICNIAIYDDELNSTLNVIRDLICGDNQNRLLNSNMIYSIF